MSIPSTARSRAAASALAARRTGNHADAADDTPAARLWNTARSAGLPKSTHPTAPPHPTAGPGTARAVIPRHRRGLSVGTGVESARPVRLSPIRIASVRRPSAVLAAAAVAAFALGVAAGPGAAAGRPVAENVWAARAVTELTGELTGPVTVPPDFETSAGYRPVTVDGTVLNPDGDCSSPVPLPAEFDTACKAHDLGYDLLRYADRAGQPLGPWARQAVDAAFDRRMRHACAARVGAAGRAGCFAAAEIADTVVDLNSRRQDYGAPVVETPIAAGVVAALLGVAALGGVILLLTRAARPISPVSAARTVLAERNGVPA
ncbi:hypothetical protein ACTD5D_11050 [Nocardia takedensis]|uniref:hypothetical protein n=1 Tax=Nocardia takedensis TaxID=259390 RepID=UPI001FDFB30E|nr:hypothetical protein [Nocardia takedensis]